jgi:hypothetical protein
MSLFKNIFSPYSKCDADFEAARVSEEKSIELLANYKKERIIALIIGTIFLAIGAILVWFFREYSTLPLMVFVPFALGTQKLMHAQHLDSLVKIMLIRK